MRARHPAERHAVYSIHWEINSTVLLYTVGVALVTGILFGLAPALQTANLNLQSALKEGGRGTGGVGPRARLRSALVVCEVALSLVLLVGASLFVRSFLNLRDADAGFDIAPLMTLRLYMTRRRVRDRGGACARVDEIVRGIESRPGRDGGVRLELGPAERRWRRRPHSDRRAHVAGRRRAVHRLHRRHAAFA